MIVLWLLIGVQVALDIYILRWIDAFKADSNLQDAFNECVIEAMKKRGEGEE